MQKWHVFDETWYSGGFWVCWLRIWEGGRIQIHIIVLLLIHYLYIFEFIINY